jgi:hypothetical protein
MAHFDKGRKYKFFPRTAEAETFYLSGESNLKNWSGDGRIRKIKRHEKYDEMWVQFGFYQKKKWLIAIFKHLRVLVTGLKENDYIHAFGTIDRWGSRRVYVIMGILKYPHPTIIDEKDYSLDLQLYKAQNKTADEIELEDYIDIRQKKPSQYHKVTEEEADKDASSSELFLPDNDD